MTRRPWRGYLRCSADLERSRSHTPVSFRPVAGAIRRRAGCPSGQRERSVKPPAQPTLVRTQHPPPAMQPPESGGFVHFRGRTQTDTTAPPVPPDDIKIAKVRDEHGMD